MAASPPDKSEGTPDPLTWPALLAKWTEFAQASVAFPRTQEGDRWRAAVPAIITLQAVTFAMGEVGELAIDERALALDRAAILIRKHERELTALWPTGVPNQMAELLADAKASLVAVGGRL